MEIVALERPRFLRHDESVGRDKLILRRASTDGREIFSAQTDDGRWTCLAYDAEKGRYVVGIYGEWGALLVLHSVSYLGERTPKLEESRFARGHRYAFATIASSDGHYLAFVDGETHDLYVLDTRRDVVRRLGRAPAPPPMDDLGSELPFDWGVGWADGYLFLEPSVLRFDGNDVLIASYGRDTHKVRAKKRTVRRFKL